MKSVLFPHPINNHFIFLKLIGFKRGEGGDSKRERTKRRKKIKDGMNRYRIGRDWKRVGQKHRWKGTEFLHPRPAPF